jgi:hypothetical protein
MYIETKNRSMLTAMCNRFVIFRDIFERQVLVDSSNILDLVEGLNVGFGRDSILMG